MHDGHQMVMMSLKEPREPFESSSIQDYLLLTLSVGKWQLFPIFHMIFSPCIQSHALQFSEIEGTPPPPSFCYVCSPPPPHGVRLPIAHYVLHLFLFFAVDSS